MLRLSKLTKDRRSIDPQSEIHIRTSMSFHFARFWKSRGPLLIFPVILLAEAGQESPDVEPNEEDKLTGEMLGKRVATFALKN
jgi:hypothetical protein